MSDSGDAGNASTHRDLVREAGVRLRYFPVDLNDAQLPLVLLVHGFGASYQHNWVQTGWVRALNAAGRSSIGLDLRGHGSSGKPHDPDAYLPERHVADLAAVLDDCAAEQVDVVAYSMGSRMTWELLRSCPGRVRRAVLAGFGPYSAPRVAGHEEAGSSAEALAAASALPGNDPKALTACQQGEARHPFTVDPVPEQVALLFAAGSYDTIAGGMEELAERVPAAQSMWVAGRNHRNAVAARALKTEALRFLAQP